MLLGAGLAALLKRMDYKDVVIGVDGTLFRKHPLFPIMMKKKISQLMGIDYKFDMVLSEDGSGIGAAIIAAVESNRPKEPPPPPALEEPVLKKPVPPVQPEAAGCLQAPPEPPDRNQAKTPSG